MMARYYSGSVGRFVSPDPLAFNNRSKEAQDEVLDNPQKWNAYTYALNNPIKFIDPDGLTEGSPQNIKKREAINSGAKKQDGSTAYRTGVKKDGF